MSDTTNDTNDSNITTQSIALSHGPVSYSKTGQGKPLILLHGWGGSSRYWHNTLSLLADARTVYSLDLPGYGQSPPFDEEITSERFVNVVLEFADALEIDRFDLNAHSFGCSIAALLTSNYPERVRRLVLTCFSTFSSDFERRMVEQTLTQMGLSLAMWHPWMSLWHPWMSLWHSWMTMLQPQVYRSVPSVYQSIAWRFFYRVPNNDTLLRDYFEDFLQMDQRTSLASILSALSPTVNVALQRIAVPTLLVAARQDMIMPPSGTPVVARLIPKCRLQWIEHCGHIPMIEKSDEYHGYVRSFLLDEEQAL